MTPDEIETARRFSQAIVNIVMERIEVGDSPACMTQAVSHALGQVLATFNEPEATAAWLRLEARKIESLAPPAKGKASVPELVQISHRAHEFMNTLQVAGIEEGDAVTATHQACLERVARRSGAAGATQWLRGLADHAEANAAALEAIARAS